MTAAYVIKQLTTISILKLLHNFILTFQRTSKISVIWNVITIIIKQLVEYLLHKESKQAHKNCPKKNSKNEKLKIN